MKLILDVCEDVFSLQKRIKNVNIELHLRVPRESKKWLCNGSYTNGNNKELNYIEDFAALLSFKGLLR